MVSKKLNIAFAVFCVLSLTCGIAFSVLVSKLMDFVFSEEGSFVATTVVWLIGLAYIVPGAFGILATALRKRPAYTIHTSLGFTAIGILVVLYFVGMVRSSVQQSSGVHFCEMHVDKCICETNELQRLTDFFTCDDINYIVRVGVASQAMFFGGGIVTFISAILSAILARRLAITNLQQANATSGTGLSYINQSGSQYQYNQTSAPQYQYNRTSAPQYQYNKPTGNDYQTKPTTAQYL